MHHQSISLIHEGRHEAAQAVDQQVATQQRRGADRPVADAAQGEQDPAGMINALKTIAEMIAERGVPRAITFSASSGPGPPPTA